MRLLRPIALLAATAAALPAIAASESSPTIEAVNKKGSGAYAEEHHAWSPEQASVATGGAVKISNPSEVPHGVRWVSGPSTPTCSSGVPVAGATPAFATKWSGTCTFTQVGTYTFYCTVHGAEMTGRVVVSAAAPPPAAPSSPLAGTESEAIMVSAKQHGRAVRGSLALSAAAAGGRLEVKLLAKAASLGGSGQAQLPAGKLARTGLQPGTATFSVPLNTRARTALRRHRRLELSVKITLTPASGSVLTVTRKVLMRP